MKRILKRAMLPLLAVSICLQSGAAFAAESILFIGNSFTYAANSAARFYHPESVTDLNDEGIGGVPALFKAFTMEAGLDYKVSLETAGGKGLDFHFASKADKIGKSWDNVVMHGYSTLDAAKPGDPALLVSSTKQVAELLHEKNSKVVIRLMATWSRPDQTYKENGHWYGKSIAAMAKDVRAGYDAAATGTPYIKEVIPVGEAWNRAIETGVADANPYDGIEVDKVDLWSYDRYHGSSYGYYLEALTVFGAVTGKDPRSLGRNERAALELGFSQAEAMALQKVAYDQLVASGKTLEAFTPVAITYKK